MLREAIFLSIVIIISCKQAPVYNFSYYAEFQQTYLTQKGYKVTKGQQFYDPLNNRQRVDRLNGMYNIFCSTIVPNVNTPCQQIVTQGKRWVLFPQFSQCCLCCTSEKGCGVRKPDWILDGNYLGETKINNTVYDLWSKMGAVTIDYLYATTDKDQHPKRIDQRLQNQTSVQTMDYDLSTYNKSQIPASAFALPGYCREKKPTNCPLQSICGKFRKSKDLTNQ